MLNKRIDMICEKCSNKHDGTYGSGRFCSKSCAHSRVRTEETKMKISESVKEWVKNNPEKIKSGTDITSYINREERLCKTCNKTFNVKENSKKVYCSRKCNPNMGGYREGSGRGNSGWYKGYYCDSSWELAFVIYNLDNNIKFTRNTKKFQYIYEGKTRNYIPDFILEDGSFLEIKGYKTKQWSKKLSQFKEPIKVLYKKEIQMYINYCIKKYGVNYIDMYDNYKPKHSYICNGCGIKFNSTYKRNTNTVYCSRTCSGLYCGRCQ